MAAGEEMLDEALLRAGCANVSCMEDISADLLRNISGAITGGGDPTGGIKSKGLSGGERWGGTANPSGKYTSSLLERSYTTRRSLQYMSAVKIAEMSFTSRRVAYDRSSCL